MPEYIIRFDGTGYRFLSNFWKCDIEFEGKTYSSTEHAFQAAKTLNDAEREQIRTSATAGAAKRLGGKVSLRPDWENLKDSVMLTVLREKFSKHKDLGDRLLDTGDKVLIEGTAWHDSYWGVCYCEKCAGVGKNRLGELLMKVREELKSPQAYAKYPADPNSMAHVIQNKSDHDDIELEQI